LLFIVCVYASSTHTHVPWLHTHTQGGIAPASWPRGNVIASHPVCVHTAWLCVCIFFFLFFLLVGCSLFFRLFRSAGPSFSKTGGGLLVFPYRLVLMECVPDGRRKTHGKSRLLLLFVVIAA
jgi:hypothetical protein